MTCFNEDSEPSDAGRRHAGSRPRPWQAVLAVALSMVLLAIVGGLLVSSPTLRYSGLVLTEILCVGLPGMILTVAGRHEPIPLLRLKLPLLGLMPAVLLMGVGGFVMAQTCGSWMERLLGPGDAPDLDRFAPNGGADTILALLAL